MLQDSSEDLPDHRRLYEIADDTCGQSQYVKYAKAAEKGLKDGTCADQGYTHKTGPQTKTYPIDILITTPSTRSRRSPRPSWGATHGAPRTPCTKSTIATLSWAS